MTPGGRWGSTRLESRSWIAAALPSRVLSTERARVLNHKDWSLVARFAARERAEPADVVYKATLLPEFRHGPAIFALLSGVCPGEVPHLLARRETAGRAEMLFRPFSGVSVQAAGDMGPCQDGRCARAYPVAGRGRPTRRDRRSPPAAGRTYPALLDGLLADIAQTYAPYWDADDGALRREFGIPDDFSDRLADFRPHLARWAATLEASGPPEFSGSRGLPPPQRRGPGRWACADLRLGTGDVGLPFLSVDVLLAFAQNFAETSAAGEDRQATLLLVEEKTTPCAVALRRAYLEAFAWGTWKERQNALDLALCLSPLRYAHAEGLLAARFGNERYQAVDLAWWLMRALRRWERTAAREGLLK